MADFVQTMKDWRRMCKTIGAENCEGCKLHTDGNDCVAVYEGEMDYAIVEKTVTAWAAEHPEPQYPTWGEYLASIGVMKPAHPDKAYEVWFTQLYSTNIPADLAQKLGIEPKEV